MSNKLVFKIEQKLVRKSKSSCNKSCRYIHKELRTVGFVFIRFFYKFLSILQVHCFGKQKGIKEMQSGPWIHAENPLESQKYSQVGPWVEGRGGLSRPKSGGSGRRRRGGSGGGARGGRDLPVCGIGWGWGLPERGRRRCRGWGGSVEQATAVLRRPWWPGLLGKGPASFTEARGTNSRGLFGRRDGGSGGSPRRGSGNGDGGGGGVFLRTGELGLVPGNESEREGRESFLVKQMGEREACCRGGARVKARRSAVLAGKAARGTPRGLVHGREVAEVMGQGRGCSRSWSGSWSERRVARALPVGRSRGEEGEERERVERENERSQLV